MEPSPMTSTLSSRRSATRSYALTQHASGSTSAASSNVTESGSFSVSSTLTRGTRTYSASAPGSSFELRHVGHTVWRPAAQSRHAKQGAWWWKNTRSPGCRRVTPSPTATTVPDGSWPSTAGTLRATYQPAVSPAQMPTVAVRTSTSPGCSDGTGRSSISARPGSRVTAARMVFGMALTASART
jgi:hypothetical protein